VLKGAENRLADACRCVLKKDDDEEELTSKDIVQAVAMVESKTSKKRLTSLIKFKDVSYSLKIFLNLFGASEDMYIFTKIRRMLTLNEIDLRSPAFVWK
jgi:ribosomal protein L14